MGIGTHFTGRRPSQSQSLAVVCEDILDHGQIVTRDHQVKHIYVLGGRCAGWKANEPCLSCGKYGDTVSRSFMTNCFFRVAPECSWHETSVLRGA